MDAKEIDGLFAQTLEGGYDDDHPWEAIRALHILGTQEVFDYAANWCASDDPLKRARGADVISQIGKTAKHPSNRFPAESMIVIAGMLRTEKVVQPLASAIFALGHLDNRSIVPAISAYHSHSSSAVRFAVAFALGCFPDDPTAIEVLLKLTTDPDADIRDWATFGLGVLGSTDSTEIRDALLARLTDEDQDAREEAVLALAKRKDRRVISVLLELLIEPQVSSRAIEAADLMLDLNSDAEDWGVEEYIARLKARFQKLD